MFAVLSGNIEVVANLLNIAANPFILNGLGQSAFDLAKIHQPQLIEIMQVAVNQWVQQADQEWIQ